MRAYVLVSADAGSRLEPREIPVPAPKAGEVLVRVRASSLNRGEFLPGGALAKSATIARPCGLEAAGEVVGLGPGVTGFAPGSRVMGRAAGGFAEYTLIDAREAMPVPEALSWEEAGAIPIAFLVAYDMVVAQGELAAGEWLLVVGASSGVGVASLQVARSLGARVIGTSGAQRKLAILSTAGLDAGIFTRGANLSAEVRRITGDHGADLAINCVGGSALEECVRALAFGGRLAIVGHLDGVRHARLDLAALHTRRLRLFGVSNKLRTAEQRARTVAGFVRDLLPRFAAGEIRPLIDRVFPFDELPAAKARMETDVHVGKIVVRVD